MIVVTTKKNTISHARLRSWRLFFAGSLLLAAQWVSAADPRAEPLSLAEAERIAVETDPIIARHAQQASALEDNAVADGQLPDPKLKFGVFNLPLDTFELDQEPTTQIRLGIQQAFPRGKTLTHRRRQTESRAAADEARGVDQLRSVRRAVRERYLEVYFQVQAGGIVRASRRLFAALVETTEAHYAVGRDNQQDVVRAQLELSRLDDRETRILSEEEAGRGKLGKWIGDRAFQSLATEFPSLPEVPAKIDIKTALAAHPAMRVEDAQVDAHQRGVQLAREQYKPGWTVGAEYRQRSGDNPDGSSRVDFLAAMVTVDLPLFPDKRQDRRLAARQKQAVAAQYARSDRSRELTSLLDREYAVWQRLGERRILYDERLSPEAQLNAQASLSAYQSAVTDFTTLMRARLTELDTRLEVLRVRVDRAKTQARLLYLAGERR